MSPQEIDHSSGAHSWGTEPLALYLLLSLLPPLLIQLLLLRVAMLLKQFRGLAPKSQHLC